MNDKIIYKCNNDEVELLQKYLFEKHDAIWPSNGKNIHHRFLFRRCGDIIYLFLNKQKYITRGNHQHYMKSYYPQTVISFKFILRKRKIKNIFKDK